MNIDAFVGASFITLGFLFICSARGIRRLLSNFRKRLTLLLWQGRGCPQGPDRNANLVTIEVT